MERGDGGGESAGPGGGRQINYNLGTLGRSCHVHFHQLEETEILPRAQDPGPVPTPERIHLRARTGPDPGPGPAI